MKYLLIFFLMSLLFHSSCRTRRTIKEWEGVATCILKNTTWHKIRITFHYNGGYPNKTFLIEKNSEAKVEEIGKQEGIMGYHRPYYSAAYPNGNSYAGIISVLYDESVLIRHYRDTIKREVKSYNRDSDRSLFKKENYTRTAIRNPNRGNVFDVQLLYTFTEDDYLFATK